jgi:hypothetical protein
MNTQAILTFGDVRKGARFVMDGKLHKKTGPDEAACHGQVVAVQTDAVVTRPEKPKSRQDRWNDAAAAARAALDGMREGADAVNAAFEELRDVAGEFEEWKGNLPESFQSSPLGEKLEAVTSLDLDCDAESETLADLEAKLDEAEGADLPLGFGRD